MSVVETEQLLLIGGEWVPAGAGETTDKVDPYTGDRVGTAASAKRDDARRAGDAAKEAFPAWANTPPAERRDLLNRAGDLLAERSEAIAATMTEETGATFGWGMFNCALAANMLRFYSGRAHDPVGEVLPSDVPGAMAMAVRRPVGVVLGIAPWNAPVILGTRAVAGPLAYGNTVVLKASEECPRTHAAIVSALVDAGLPAGAINLITNDVSDAADVVEELIAHPAVRRINFTGSTKVGRIIAEKAATHLKRCLLELGGKAPQVVLADADLDLAADAASFGAFMNTGQICMSTERIVVDRSVAGEFAEKLAERASKLKVGDPRDQETQIGPLINAGAVERVSGLVDDARSQGADVLSGGQADGTLYPPTVISGVTPDMRVYREESFGPLVALTPVDGDDAAIAAANDTEYGLSSAVFSRDVPRALSVAQRIESGICHINSATVHDEAQMPFGGVKDSGYGRFGGRAAQDEFTELRWITIQETAKHYPI
jgi:acyl-CoA reductase-like NAD-dependent aldehyde dehydrogenase